MSLKHLIWSGSFLSKIDLSEISFDGVIWNVTYCAEEYFNNNSKNLYQEYGVTMIDLSNTNAKIDFSKAFGSEFKDSSVGVEVICCNFSNTNLSNNLIDYDFVAEECNFSNTGLGVNFKSESDIGFYSSILSGLDFSEYTVDETFFGEEYQQFKAVDCDLSNTGLNVRTTNIPSDIMSKYKKWLSLNDLVCSDDISNQEIDRIKRERGFLYNETEKYRISLDGMKYLGEAMAKGYLVGCCVNGKKVLSAEERHTLASEKLQEYEAYKQEVFSSVESSIEEQIRRLKR